MDKAERSLLQPAIVESRVIPNGVDTSVFRPGDREDARSRLGLPPNSRIVLCVGSAERSPDWPAERLPEPALAHLQGSSSRDLVIVFLGCSQGSEAQLGGIRLVYRVYERNSSTVASYFKASDVYVHATRADTFPTTVLEALACGVPVVATDVGGIPEQVRSIWPGGKASASPPTAASGILVQPGDLVALAKSIECLMKDDALRRRLGENGARAASLEFSIDRQVERNLTWFREILKGQRPLPRRAFGTRDRR
jgi:glycosyltransferase involved in cell wall biosynthesis